MVVANLTILDIHVDTQISDGQSLEEPIIVANTNAIRQFGPFPFGSLDRNFSA